ncbi:MAG: phosphoribosyltransferase [Microscillaceae bacterium]|nr:phosphoribosyltransferase [Microscillaceae bacterium]
MPATQLLDSAQIDQKLRRLAYQIYEKNFLEKALVFAGVQGSGYLLAQRLKSQVESISSLRIALGQVSIHKESPLEKDIQFDIPLPLLQNQVILLVDDVLNTGRTMAYCLRLFLNLEVNRLQTLVLVDRKHRLYPIAADFVGFSLATTLQEHIQVILGEEEAKNGVFLS